MTEESQHPTAPRFRVDKKAKPPRVFLQCTKCHKDIREMKPGERISVRRAYYHDECDPGAIVLNMPTEKDDADD